MTWDLVDPKDIEKSKEVATKKIQVISFSNS